MENSLMQQNNNLEIVQRNKDIVQSIISGECTIPEDIANKFNISYEEVINLFSNPNFTSLITKYSQAKLKMSFYGKDLNRLDDIIKNTDDKIAIQGIKLKAQLTNAIKGNSIPDVNVGINFNLESLVKESEKEKQIPVMDIDFERK